MCFLEEEEEEEEEATEPAADEEEEGTTVEEEEEEEEEVNDGEAFTLDEEELLVPTAILPELGEAKLASASSICSLRAASSSSRLHLQYCRIFSGPLLCFTNAVR
jgi:hypothetical protein